MRYKTLFRIICKAIGVYFMVIGTSGLVGSLAGFVATIAQYARLGPQYSSGHLWSLLLVASPLMQLLGGLYLFFDGRLVADLAVPGNRPYCPECGYDLSAASSDVCPECGTSPVIGRRE